MVDRHTNYLSTLSEWVGGLVVVDIGVWLWWNGGLYYILSSSSHVLEVRCTSDGFGDHKLCLKPEEFGAELEFRVNTTTQKVQLTVVKSDFNWVRERDLIFDDCSVVDTDNWKCGNEYNEQGMSHGRYYRSLTMGSPPHI